MVYTAAMRIIFFLVLLFVIGCSSRAPIPPGTVPQQITVSAADEQYGHDVLSALTEQFPLDTSDERINRVRDIADRLAIASGNDQNPWHVHVLKDDSVKNAAATRGNYLFVWSGMFNTIRDDTELATIISHEMGHVLANHTAATPEEEAAAILSGVVGMAASGVLSARGYGGLSDLAQVLVENVFKAALVNPGSQANELEADHIGLFLMSDAGYNPEEAYAFWQRVQSDPDFQSATLQFFSSHPSTQERVQQLAKYLDAAKERYQLALGHKPGDAKKNQIAEAPKSKPLPSAWNKEANLSAHDLLTAERWVVAVPSAQVLTEADNAASVSGTLPEGTEVTGTLVKRRWLSLTSPLTGYIRSANLSPAK